MAYVTLVENVVRWATIEIDDKDETAEAPDESPAIREQTLSYVAVHGWDGEDVLEATWQWGEDV